MQLGINPSGDVWAQTIRTLTTTKFAWWTNKKITSNTGNLAANGSATIRHTLLAKPCLLYVRAHIELQTNSSGYIQSSEYFGTGNPAIINKVTLVIASGVLFMLGYTDHFMLGSAENTTDLQLDFHNGDNANTANYYYDIVELDI